MSACAECKARDAAIKALLEAEARIPSEWTHEAIHAWLHLWAAWATDDEELAEMHRHASRWIMVQITSRLVAVGFGAAGCEPKGTRET